MSKVNTSVSNLKYLPLNDTSSICFGEISVNIKDSDTFHIPGNIKSNSHIVLTNPKSDNILRSIMTSSPLIPEYSVTIYDYSSTVTNRYLQNRQNNSPGTVNNQLSKIKLLSQITLPKVNEEDDVYLVLDSYESLEEVCLEESKKQIISTDMELFLAKNLIEYQQKSNINLFVTQEIYDTIKKYIDIENIFKKIWICKKACLPALVEYMMGKVIYCSDKSYQGHISLSSGFEISSVLISSKSTDTMIGRSNGILQYNTFNGSTSFNFIIILEHQEPKSNIKFFENSLLIGTSTLLEDTDSKITPDYIRSFKDNYDFCNNLKKLDNEDKRKFILDNSEKVIKYFMMTLEPKDYFNGDYLELVHLSNIDYLDIIKSQLLNEFSNHKHTYPNMRQFGLAFESPETVAHRIPLERHISAATFN